MVVGNRYTVHHEGYLVHRPHPNSAAKSTFLKSLGQSGGNTTYSDIIGNEAASALGSISGDTDRWFGQQLGMGSNFRVLVAPGWLACAKQLPWWNQVMTS